MERQISGATTTAPLELLSSLRDSRFVSDGFPALAGWAVFRRPFRGYETRMIFRGDGTGVIPPGERRFGHLARHVRVGYASEAGHSPAMVPSFVSSYKPNVREPELRGASGRGIS